MRDAAALVIIIINFATMFIQWNPSQGGTPRSIQFSRVAHRFSPNLHMTTIWQRLENQSYCLVYTKKNPIKWSDREPKVQGNQAFLKIFFVSCDFS